MQVHVRLPGDRRLHTGGAAKHMMEATEQYRISRDAGYAAVSLWIMVNALGGL